MKHVGLPPELTLVVLESEHQADVCEDLFVGRRHERLLATALCRPFVAPQERDKRYNCEKLHLSSDRPPAMVGDRFLPRFAADRLHPVKNLAQCFKDT